MSAALAPVFGAGLGGARFHAGAASERAADAVGARAFALGRDVVLGRGEGRDGSGDGLRVLAHETAHVAQQARSPGAARIQRIPIPNVDSAAITPEALANANTDELRSALQGALAAINWSSPEASQSHVRWGNVEMLLGEAHRRGVSITGPENLRIASRPEERASAPEIAGLETRIDLLATMARAELPAEANDLVARLEQRRTLIRSIHRDEVLAEGGRLETYREALERVVLARSMTPAAQGNADSPMAQPTETLRRAGAAAAQTLFTDAQTAAVAGLEQARADFMSSYARTLVVDAQETLRRLPPPGDTIENLDWYTDGYAEGGRIVFGARADDYDVYLRALGSVRASLTRMGDLGAVERSSAAERLTFLSEHGDALLDDLQRASAVLLMRSGIELAAQVLQHAFANAQGTSRDWMIAVSIQSSVVAPLVGELSGEAAPTNEALRNAQASLATDSDRARARFVEIETTLRRIEIFANIAATLIGAGAMSLVMESAVMRAGWWATGSRLAVGGKAVLRFAVSSLVFTTATTAARSLLTWRLPTARQFATQAAMDAATLGVMRLTGGALGLAYRGAPVPPIVGAGVTFTTLWTWSMGWRLALDPATREHLAESAAETGVEIGLTMLAMHLGQQVARLPSVRDQGEANPAARRAVARFEQVRRDGDAFNWRPGRGRTPAEGRSAWARWAAALDGWVGRYRMSLGGLREAGVLSEPEYRRLYDETFKWSEVARSIQDTLRLGIENVSESVMRYTGRARNMAQLLQRWQNLGQITSFTARPNGIFEVRTPDGATRFFSPEGTTVETTVDFGADSLQRAAPDVAEAVRSNALMTLRRLPAGEANELIIAVEHAPDGPRIVAWLARPDTAGAVAAEPTPFHVDLLLRAINDATSREIVTAVPAEQVRTWWAIGFQRVTGGAGRSAEAFLDFLRRVRELRGSLRVASSADANAVLEHMASATTAYPYNPAAPEPAAMSAPDSPAPRSPRTWFNNNRITRGLLTADLDGAQYYVQIDPAGAPARAWRFRNGTDTPELEVDLAGELAALRTAVTAAESSGGQLTALRPRAHAIDFVRRMRAPALADAAALLDRILGPSLPAAPPEPAPGAVPARAPGPTPLLPPPAPDPTDVARAAVSPQEVLGEQRNAVLGRATRMGAATEAEVRAVNALQPRGATSPAALAEARTTLDAATRRLDELATGAIAEARERIGEPALGRLRARAFRGKTDIQAGEALYALLRNASLTTDALAALSHLPEGAPLAQLGDLDPMLIAAIASLSQRFPEAGTRLLGQPGLLRELGRDPVAAFEFLRALEAMLPLMHSETHRHTVGGLQHGRLMLDRLAAASTEQFNGLPANPGRRASQEARDAWQAGVRAAREAELTERSNTIENTVARFIEALPPGEYRTATAAEWAEVLPQIAPLRDAVAANIRDGTPLPATYAAQVNAVGDRLQRILQLRVEITAHGQQTERFFALYRSVSDLVWGGTMRQVAGVRSAMEVAAGERIVHIELRQGGDARVMQAIQQQIQLTQAGRLPANVRLIVTITRNTQPGEIRNMLARLEPFRDQIAGFDLSGEERTPLEAEAATLLIADVAKHNFRLYAAAMRADPTLHTELTRRLGTDPLINGSLLMIAIDAPTPSPVDPNAPGLASAGAGARLAMLNRLIREALVDVEVATGVNRVPQGLQGVTMHAGEQVASGARSIRALLQDVQTSIAAGTDRIGHGLVLGIPLPAGLARLGFAQRPGGEWMRSLGVARPPEVYTPAELAEMEALRVRLIGQAADRHVTIETNPTSNFVLSGLRATEHPVREMLAVRPDLRVSVATDNPSFHATDIASELALASASIRAGMGVTVRLYLEGFRSRFGGGQLPNAPALRAEIVEAIANATPAPERAAVLSELGRVYGANVPPNARTAMDVATFRTALRPFVDLAVR